nr:pyridoxamine 5'-phosphate oxidase family protein [uncultured Desulfuromonas sp.]
MDSTQLETYFRDTAGTGILSTAGSDGRVNSALYAKPRFFDDGSVAFIMLDRLSHHYVAENPYAAYLFIENGPGYGGVRLHLRKVSEELNTPRIETMLSAEGRSYVGNKDRYLVFFAIEKILPLVTPAQDKDL